MLLSRIECVLRRGDGTLYDWQLAIKAIRLAVAAYMGVPLYCSVSTFLLPLRTIYHQLLQHTSLFLHHKLPWGELRPKLLRHLLVLLCFRDSLSGWAMLGEHGRPISNQTSCKRSGLFSFHIRPDLQFLSDQLCYTIMYILFVYMPYITGGICAYGGDVDAGQTVFVLP